MTGEVQWGKTRRPQKAAGFADRKNPVEQYDAFMKLALPTLNIDMTVDPTHRSSDAHQQEYRDIRKFLFRELGRSQLRPELQQVLNEIGLSASWVRNHLLAIGTWSERVQQAVRDGLSIRNGAVVARIRRRFERDVRSRRRLMHWGVDHVPLEASASMDSWASQIDDLIDEYEVTALQSFYGAQNEPVQASVSDTVIAAEIRHTVEGILIQRLPHPRELSERQISSKRAQPDQLSSDMSFSLKKRKSPKEAATGPGVKSLKRLLWMYPPPSPEDVRREILPSLIARSLITTYLPRSGGFVIDPMAGSGVTVHMALKYKHRVWAGDLHPTMPLIEQYDVTDKRLLPFKDKPRADLLILHPPTYSKWKSTAGIRSSPDLYLAFLRHLMTTHEVLLHPGGYVALILQPFPDQRGDVRGGVTIEPPASRPHTVGLHVAAARDGSQAWVLLVFSDVLISDEPSYEEPQISTSTDHTERFPDNSSSLSHRKARNGPRQHPEG